VPQIELWHGQEADRVMTVSPPGFLSVDGRAYNHIYCSCLHELGRMDRAEEQTGVRQRPIDQAWREVLDDPHYTKRRHYEERIEDQTRAAATNR
jgi:hypothetical protein